MNSQVAIKELQTVEAPALTDWKNAPTVADLKQDIQDAHSAHSDQMAKISHWLNLLRVTGAVKPQKLKNRSSVAPKLIRKQAEWRYPSLSEPFLSTEDLFKVKPVTWEDRVAAQQNQLVLNHQFNNNIDRETFIDEYIRTVVDEGTVITKTSWVFEEEEYYEEVPIVEYVPSPQYGPMILEIEQIKEESPAEYLALPDEIKVAFEMSMETGMPHAPNVLGYETVKKTRTVLNHPYVEVCDNNNVIIDPSCHGILNKAGFIVHRYSVSLSDLKRDSRYKNLDYINTNESILSEPDYDPSKNTSNFNFNDKPRKKMVMYEYWGSRDIDGTGVVKPIVASWIGNVMVRLEENPYPDKMHPFSSAALLPIRKSVYGEPDAELLEDNQQIIGAVTRGMIDIMARSANGQTGMRKDMLDAVNKRRFERGMDYEFNQNVDPRQGVHMHAYPEIPASAQYMVQSMNMEAEALTGVKAFYGGLSGDGLGEVAAGIRGVLDAASKREISILRRLANGILDIGRKFIAMNAVFMDEEQVIAITNEEFVKVKRDDLAGKVNLRLTISTAEEDDKKAQELSFLMQTLGNNMDPGLQKMILSDFARLRKMPDLAKKIESYEPEPDPLMQEKMMLEVELLRAQVENERAHALERQSKAQLDGVKAGNVQSDTDLKNLDFVEQESGVKQERDLQKQGEQARANMRLELLKKQLQDKSDKK